MNEYLLWICHIFDASLVYQSVTRCVRWLILSILIAGTPTGEVPTDSPLPPPLPHHTAPPLCLRGLQQDCGGRPRQTFAGKTQLGGREHS